MQSIAYLDRTVHNLECFIKLYFQFNITFSYLIFKAL